MIAEAVCNSFDVSSSEQPGIELQNIEYVSYPLMDAKMHCLTKRWTKKGLSHEKLCLGYRIKRTIMSYFAVENTCELLKASGNLV